MSVPAVTFDDAATSGHAENEKGLRDQSPSGPSWIIFTRCYLWPPKNERMANDRFEGLPLWTVPIKTGPGVPCHYCLLLLLDSRISVSDSIIIIMKVQLVTFIVLAVVASGVLCGIVPAVKTVAVAPPLVPSVPYYVHSEPKLLTTTKYVAGTPIQYVVPDASSSFQYIVHGSAPVKYIVPSAGIKYIPDGTVYSYVRPVAYSASYSKSITTH